MTQRYMPILKVSHWSFHKERALFACVFYLIYIIESNIGDTEKMWTAKFQQYSWYMIEKVHTVGCNVDWILLGEIIHLK